MKPSEQTRARELYAAGVSRQEISIELGVSPVCCHRLDTQNACAEKALSCLQQAIPPQTDKSAIL